MVCERAMVLGRMGAKQDDMDKYQVIGMAKTGTARHEHMQAAMVKAFPVDGDWEYVDVADYITKMGITDVKVVSKQGYETKLFHEGLNLSFLCDGILYHRPTDRYFLFEFKNQASPKTRVKGENPNYNPNDGKSKKIIWMDKVDMEEKDSEYIPQIRTYCYCLKLNWVMYVCEARDFCKLIKPMCFKVTDKQKQEQADRLLRCECMFEKGELPPQIEDSTFITEYCRKKCNYKESCIAYGHEEVN